LYANKKSVVAPISSLFSFLGRERKGDVNIERTWRGEEAAIVLLLGSSL
jgi:hypothetical protein